MRSNSQTTVKNVRKHSLPNICQIPICLRLWLWTQCLRKVPALSLPYYMFKNETIACVGLAVIVAHGTNDNMDAQFTNNIGAMF